MTNAEYKIKTPTAEDVAIARKWLEDRGFINLCDDIDDVFIIGLGTSSGGIFHWQSSLINFSEWKGVEIDVEVIKRQNFLESKVVVTKQPVWEHLWTSLETPPLGLRPKKIALEARLKEVLEAMLRYVQAGKSIPGEWVTELSELYSWAGD